MTKQFTRLNFAARTYELGVVYSDILTHIKFEIVSILQIDGEHYIIVRVSDIDNPGMFSVRQFNELVVSSRLRKVDTAKYSVGDRFEHPMSNRSMKVLSVSPDKCSTNDSFTYFMELMKANGEPFYNTMSESFLDKCVRDKF